MPRNTRLRRLAALATLVSVGALVGLAGGRSAEAGTTGCGWQPLVQPFVPWLDPNNYVLVPSGAVESTSGWTLSGGATPVSGNEPWKVNARTDSRSLSLPSGSSATTPPLCITLFHPDLRFFAVNSGAPLTTLKVEAITTVAGTKQTTLVGVLKATATWQPTLPVPFLGNLVVGTSGTVQFRFTPVGSNSGWRIDDVYVDPLKSR